VLWIEYYYFEALSPCNSVLHACCLKQGNASVATLCVDQLGQDLTTTSCPIVPRVRSIQKGNAATVDRSSRWKQPSCLLMQPYWSTVDSLGERKNSLLYVQVTNWLGIIQRNHVRRDDLIEAELFTWPEMHTWCLASHRYTL